VHPNVRMNYLASPPLVVAYAIAGTVDIDLANGVIARTPDGKDVYLKDIWPTTAEIDELRTAASTREQFVDKYADVFTGNPTWNEVPVSESELYGWDDASTYIQNPPFFEGMGEDAPGFTPIRGARVLALLGDSVTTDHISPAGRIEPETPAGQYLINAGVAQSNFNSFGSRRGNDRVMTRGTFANVRVRNKIAAGPDGTIPEGGWTRDFTKAPTLADAPQAYIYDAAQNYKAAGTPSSSSRARTTAWAPAATGPPRAPCSWASRPSSPRASSASTAPTSCSWASSRSSTRDGQTAETLGLTGEESFDVFLPDVVGPGQDVKVVATRADGSSVEFTTKSRLDTPVEIEYYRHGGILQTVIRKKLNESKQHA
jgi:aconitate hydratase